MTHEELTKFKNRFKELYLKHYGIEISEEEALFRLNNLVSLYEAVYGGNLADERASPSNKEGEIV